MNATVCLSMDLLPFGRFIASTRSIGISDIDAAVLLAGNAPEETALCAKMAMRTAAERLMLAEPAGRA